MRLGREVDEQAEEAAPVEEDRRREHLNRKVEIMELEMVSSRVETSTEKEMANRQQVSREECSNLPATVIRQQASKEGVSNRQEITTTNSLRLENPYLEQRVHHRISSVRLSKWDIRPHKRVSHLLLRRLEWMFRVH